MSTSELYRVASIGESPIEVTAVRKGVEIKAVVKGFVIEMVSPDDAMTHTLKLTADELGPKGAEAVIALDGAELVLADDPGAEKARKTDPKLEKVDTYYYAGGVRALVIGGVRLPDPTHGTPTYGIGDLTQVLFKVGDYVRGTYAYVGDRAAAYPDEAADA